MKRIIATTLFALASLVTVNSAMAQNYRIRVNIPFTFIAGSTRLPAGTYTITSQNSFGVVIQNGKQQATILSSVPLDDNRAGDVRLVFNVYGDKHFLNKILCPDGNLNLALTVSKMEKSVRLQEENLHGNDQSGLWVNK